MRKLLVVLCVSALMFGCSEEAEEMMDKAGDMAEDSADVAAEMMDDGVKEPTVESLPDWDSLPPLEGEIKGPTVASLPDWDALPPIEEEMAAEEGSTMMEKAEEKMKKE